MRVLICILIFITNVFAKSPFVGNSFAIELLSEKSSIKSARDFEGDEGTESKDGKVKIAPKSFQLSFSHRTELSKYFMLVTDAFIKVNAINHSESSGDVKTKFTKYPLGYGIGIGIGMFLSPINLLTVNTFCENIRMKCEDTSDLELSQNIKKSSVNKFLTGFKIENFTAISKNKFLKVSVTKHFNEKITACQGEHSVSGVTIGVGMSVKF